MLKEKIAQFIEKHGYTMKAYAVAFIVFPPAALFLSWKIPSKPLIVRCILTLLAFIPLLAPFFVGALLISSE